jgi:transcriptional regulator with PAS, ATPase and Fis domain
MNNRYDATEQTDDDDFEQSGLEACADSYGVDDEPTVSRDEAAAGILSLGQSEKMLEVAAMIEKVAPTQATVLLIGESGTGKEVAANAIHALSKQCGKPFVAVNCGAIPPTLIEAELFGYERGAFTGAVRSRKGFIERAEGGTLFLDEITEMSPDMQVKLLRVLETGCLFRVGGESEIRADVRIIAATNRDPERAVADGQLRADLLYRLAVFPLELPPLRERGADIERLAYQFLEQFNAEEPGVTKRLSNDSLEFLRNHSWPGNVRELKNTIHRAFILSDEIITLADCVRQSDPASAGESLDTIVIEVGSSLAHAERSLIGATLELCDGNKRQAAQILGVSLKTLYNRLNEYKTPVSGPQPSNSCAA